ncbi:histone-lysine N-methyltransferase SETMAR-like protein [Plakobranchus ocellatus]|uniref:Histone-lysine N-methyltransferase SETMAR-like protein n=1 Tax=Plakobranchus ocellatus TaxID=259542 RepID=A0AAV3YGL8_9GAST|nr:histone-lysine N-methyltransferase SETMAR-like protein [Plakobranchus ocellatus]
MCTSKASCLKVMHIIFFDTFGIIFRWPVSTGTTVKVQYYKIVIKHKLRSAIRKIATRTLAIWRSGVTFHDDTSPLHTELLDVYEWSVLEHPRYSPELALFDFWLFPKMKEHHRGHRFESEDGILFATKEAIRRLDKDSYITAFDSWLQRMQKCIDNGGCCVE